MKPRRFGSKQVRVYVGKAPRPQHRESIQTTGAGGDTLIRDNPLRIVTDPARNVNLGRRVVLKGCAQLRSLER
ncbi:MAG: hypothetical protein NTY41_16690 [Proteobacteria bacterium]|nr:hypothetical protein [Pseudomonadota bacterium]